MQPSHGCNYFRIARPFQKVVKFIILDASESEDTFQKTFLPSAPIFDLNHALNFASQIEHGKDLDISRQMARGRKGMSSADASTLLCMFIVHEHEHCSQCWADVFLLCGYLSLSSISFEFSVVAAASKVYGHRFGSSSTSVGARPA